MSRLMMRSLFSTAVAFGLIVSSCSKEVSVENGGNGPTPPPIPPVDSITLVKSVTNLSYDDQGKLAFYTEEVYDFQSPLKTVVSYKDSTLFGVTNFKETWTYNTNGDVVQFTTAPVIPYTIDFTYSSPGKLQKAVIADNGEPPYENTFKYSTQGSQTLMTMYDTSGTFGQHGDLRPRILHYEFDANNRVVRALEAASGDDKSPQARYKDSTLERNYYDNNGNISKFVRVYFEAPYFAYDSTSFTRGPAGGELADTWKAVYRNISWFNSSWTINRSFASSLAHTVPFPFLTYYTKNNVVSLSNTYFDSFDPTPQVTPLSIQHSFDTEGRITKTVYPPYAGNKYGGTTTLTYTYQKVRK